MPRWLAIGTAPGWDDPKKFRAELDDTREWRVDPRTTVTTVYALGDGRLLAECHGTRQEDFEAWLKKKGWKVETVQPIKLLAKTGSIWEVR
ncbi:MAG: hypothetical protein HY535_09015 [Chloroflexi bacterium]|nr:hypothetical protein [Chloroflexota bacterium]